MFTNVYEAISCAESALHHNLEKANLAAANTKTKADRERHCIRAKEREECRNELLPILAWIRTELAKSDSRTDAAELVTADEFLDRWQDQANAFQDPIS